MKNPDNIINTILYLEKYLAFHVYRDFKHQWNIERFQTFKLNIA